MYILLTVPERRLPELQEERVMRKTLHALFGMHLPLRLVLFNIITVIGLIGGTLSFGVSLATGLPAVQNVVVFLSLIVLGVCLYLANCKGKSRLASVIIIVLITFFLLPAMFFTGGGVHSGMPSWFVIGMIFTCLLIEGRLCWALLGVQVVLYLLCFVTAYFHPELIRSFPTETGAFVDIVQSMFIAALVIGPIIRFQSFVYESILKKYKEQNAQLKAAENAANIANAAKTDFLAHISHDIRTPMNGILGMLDISERNLGNPEKLADCRRKIRISSEHLLSLVNDVLDISRLEKGKVEFTKENFDVKRLLEDCVAITLKHAEARNVSLSLNADGIPQPLLEGSPLHVRQVVINIIENAIKYNRKGGRVRITAAEEPRKDGTFIVQICIEDTGIGMSPEFLKKAFEPFTQENNGARTEYSGTGLGLAITKRLVEQMGGDIGVESRVSEGSIFTVRIPFRAGTPSASVPDGAAGQLADLRGMKLLLVEDNELNMEIAQYILQEAGAFCVPAMDGREALNKFAASAPGEYDCVLMDIMMPEMDGLEATRQIRLLERDDAKTVPVVAMTANAFAEDIQKAKDAGMNAHLAKPIDPVKMCEAVAAYRRNKETAV